MVHGPKLSIAEGQGLLQKSIPEVGVGAIKFAELVNIIHVGGG
jgi:hypothetical protein